MNSSVDSANRATYQTRIAAEKEFFQGCTDVHGGLPPIFHYWSNKWIRPKLEIFGASNPSQFFENCLLRHCQNTNGRPLRFVSIGSGNCDLEVQLAERLLHCGYSNLVLDCLDLNPDMLCRGRELAAQKGVTAQIGCIEADFNDWRPGREYDVVIACQSLHHVVNLEGLFAQIRGALAPGGHFITADVIGRNGHLRWPEALEIVHELWRELPASHRRNLGLKRYEELYENWDCSTEGFEGIRAQDILPLLLEHFQFEMFVAFGNVIDPFVDRAFGHNYNLDSEWDRNFIDRVHLRDEQEMRNGRIKPTQMLAIMGNDRAAPTRYLAPLSPEFSVRWTDAMRRVPENLEHQRLELLDSNKQLNERLRIAEWQIQEAANSKWLRLGRRLGLGPKLG